MSVAALEAVALADCLRERSDLAGLPRRFFRRAARIIDGPWLLATGADFLYPGAVGQAARRQRDPSLAVQRQPARIVGG